MALAHGEDKLHRVRRATEMPSLRMWAGRRLKHSCAVETCVAAPGVISSLDCRPGPMVLQGASEGVWLAADDAAEKSKG